MPLLHKTSVCSSLYGYQCLNLLGLVVFVAGTQVTSIFLPQCRLTRITAVKFLLTTQSRRSNRNAQIIAGNNALICWYSRVSVQEAPRFHLLSVIRVLFSFWGKKSLRVRVFPLDSYCTTTLLYYDARLVTVPGRLLYTCMARVDRTTETYFWAGPSHFLEFHHRGFIGSIRVCRKW